MIGESVGHKAQEGVSDQDGSKDPHTRHLGVFILNDEVSTIMLSFIDCHLLNICYVVGTKLSISYTLYHAILTNSIIYSIAFHLYM